MCEYVGSAGGAEKKRKADSVPPNPEGDWDHRVCVSHIITLSQSSVVVADFGITKNKSAHPPMHPR